MTKQEKIADWRLKNRKHVLRYARNYYWNHRQDILNKLKAERPRKRRLLAKRWDKWYSKNKTRRNKSKRANRGTDYQRNRMMLYYHGVDIHFYNDLLRQQKGVCAICKRRPHGKGRWGPIKHLFIDHCHKSKIIRGLLCHPCNRTLGLFRDNPQVFQNMADYLRK